MENSLIIKNKDILAFFNKNKDIDPEKLILDAINFFSYFKNSSLEKKIDELIPSINNFDISEKVKQYIEKTIIVPENLQDVLIKNFPVYDISYTGDQADFGDYYIQRADKKPILITNKHCISNLDISVTNRFINDIGIRKTHGILVSQKSGIFGKNDLEIELFGSSILVYIHNCNYDITKIRSAFDIIDNLSDTMNKFSDTGINIPYKILSQINSEYRQFDNKKKEIVKSIKDNQKKIIDDIIGLKFLRLEEILKDNFASFEDSEFQCIKCGKTFRSQNAINSHMKFH